MKKYNSKKHNRKDSLLKGVGAAGAVVGGAVLYSQGNVVYAAETTNTLEERGELEEKLDLQQSASESAAPESLLSTENQDSLSASESTSVSESESESQTYLDSETALEDQPAESKVTNVYMPLASFTKLQSVEIREDGIITIDGNNWQDYIEVSSGVVPEIIDGVDGQKYVKFTLTKAENSQVGNIHLKNKIDMNSSFTIKGVVNLGNVSTSQDYGQTVIADGIGIAFHTGNTDQVGKTGANMGIGGIENATGFELDTYRNGGAGNASGSNYGWAPDNAAVYHVYNKGNAKEYTVVDKTEGYYGAAVKTYGVRWKDKSTFVLENGLTFTKKTGYDGDYYDVKKDSKGVAAFTALSNKQTYYYMFADSIVKMDGTNGSQNLTSTITEPNKTFDYELSYDGSSRTLKMVIKGGKDVTKEETYQETKTTYEKFDDSGYWHWWGAFNYGKYEADAKAAGYTIEGRDNRYYKAVTETVTKTRTVTTQEDLVLTTHVDSADEAMSLVISASTGAYNALQQFQINEMTYKAARSVDIKYVDENGNVIPNVKQAEIEYIKDETGERTGFQIKGQDIPGYKYLDVSIENETGNVNLVVDDWNNDGLKDARGSLTKPGNNATILFRYVSIEHFNSVSNSVSTSTSISDSISNSISTSTSVSNSLSDSTSTSNSLSDSTSTSNSLSDSTSISNSLSDSTSTSLSESESTSTSLSESESTSTSLSESESTSTSLSESESTSTSLSESESASTSLSESESTSTSLSESESTSTRLSESESSSTSLSESESTSTSLSESESTSTSLSESESTSTSISESESTSTSLSESESTSTSLSESESTSTSLSESESTSTSLSLSESTSTSLSESESTSISLSESESTSTSISESESTSTSLSESESTSTSLSESESTSTSLSESESESTSISLSESESTSTSLSES
ncbi:MAG: hypothetical protein PUB40_07830, partial [Lachnospiraceae bacterium]|nr:hypothetical protein [Lachnospiraceae bacterium]